ncbi:hypothetical protein DOTSEDRAFT_46806 [Dothistroma septosporum NZE10]|uniref:Uncharacterized protein n=1 Tax=Dothistroma septosporum (strain NZE10 / CBS 128990) TaxID=675120 RepID=N1PFP8_DOTSN|nr:hypothetical protein DOTSEDRAFT_46806 [Dothistroma septosporum NZE10]
MSSAHPDLTPHFGRYDAEKQAEYDLTPTPYLFDFQHVSEYGFKLPQSRQTIGGSSQDGPNTSRVRTGRKQEIQHDFRYLSTIGFTTLVMGT